MSQGRAASLILSYLSYLTASQTVTSAEMNIDKENGWSKGFGFVSFSAIEEADAAMVAVHGSWMAGREMKVSSA